MTTPATYSVSQHKTLSDCQRKWAFGKLFKLPEPPKPFLAYGTALHAVCERYLEAPDTGDPDLYPKGWDEDINPSEAAQIRRLVARAIDEGILVREPGREIEKEIRLPLIKGMDLLGYIDVWTPTSVTDHKTSKNDRYLLSRRALESDLQVLAYAKVCFDADPKLDRVRVRHNQFVKDPSNPEVRMTEGWVTRQDVEHNWRELQEGGRIAQTLRAAGFTLDQWREIPGAKAKGTCRKYGGCEFTGVCTGTQTIEEYIEQTKASIEAFHNPDPLDEFIKGRHTSTNHATDEKKPPMSDILARLAALKNGATPSTNGHAPAPAPAPAANPVVESDDAPERDTPPWANPTCRACEGAGFDTRGNACRICVSKAKKDGKPLPAQFEIEIDETTILWSDGRISGSAPVPGSETPTTSSKRQAPPAEQHTPAAPVDEAPVASVSEATEAAAEPSGDSAPATEEPEEEAPRVVAGSSGSSAAPSSPTPNLDARLDDGRPAGTRGRKPVSLMVYVDCAPQGIETVPLERIMQELGEQLAHASGKSSYYDLDCFRRRDAWHQMTQRDITERFGKVHAVVRSPDGQPDLAAFLEALRVVLPAGNLIEGLR